MAARAAAVIIVETEIWPNFLRECRRAQVPVIFVNGRLSERSFRGYGRALSYSAGALAGFLKKVLGDATLFLMQSEEDAARLIALGAPGERVLVSGNLKYDVAEPDESPLSTWLEAELAKSNRRPVVVAGSVLANEEISVLRAFADVEREFPRALLILAPRKPEQFDNAATIVAESGRKLLRRRDLVFNGAGSAVLPAPVNVFLLDSLGELGGLYRLADAVFVGGSLVPGGGHNILEPAAFGKVPIYGPSMENFREMSEISRGGRCDPGEKFGRTGRRVGQVCSGNRSVPLAWGPSPGIGGPKSRRDAACSAAHRTIAWSQSGRKVKPVSRWLRLLWPLSLLYSLLARAKAWCYARGIFRKRKLPGTVIGVGNLTVGGTGKTPMVLAIAERLAQEGKHAAILTRGYRGTADAGASGVPQSDEVALLRERLAGKVQLGVGADRYKSGVVLARHGIDWFVLDDGFQHLKLSRDADVVLVDATDPFGGGMVLPAGDCASRSRRCGARTLW